MRGALPVAAGLEIVGPEPGGHRSQRVRPVGGIGVVAVDVDAGAVAEQIGRVRGDGNNGEGVPVGAGGIDDVGFCHGTAGRPAGLENASPQDMNPRDRPLRSLPVVIQGETGIPARIGRDPRVGGCVVAACAQGQGRAVDRRGLGRLRTVERVADGSAGHRGGQANRLPSRVNPPVEGDGRRVERHGLRARRDVSRAPRRYVVKVTDAGIRSGPAAEGTADRSTA